MKGAPGVAIGLCLLLLSGACAGASDSSEGALTTVAEVDDGQSTATPSQSPTTAPPTTALPTSASPDETTGSSAPAETTTTENTAAGVCPTVELPSGPTTAPAVVEVDNDGVADSAYMVQTNVGWQAVIEFGAGGATVAALSGTNDFDQPFIIGDADLDGDGVNELAVSMGVGAYVGLIGFVRVRDCGIVQLAFEDNSPAVFASGASVGGGEALVCYGEGTIEVYFFSLLPGSDAGSEDAEYEGGYAPYRLEGDTFVAYPGDGATLTGADVATIDLLDCLGLELSL